MILTVSAASWLEMQYILVEFKELLLLKFDFLFSWIFSSWKAKVQDAAEKNIQWKVPWNNNV